MLIVGYYYSSEEQCKLEVSKYVCIWQLQTTFHHQFQANVWLKKNGDRFATVYSHRFFESDYKKKLFQE